MSIKKIWKWSCFFFSTLLMTWYVYNSSDNCVGNNIVVVLLVLVKICIIMTQRCFMLCTTYTNFWSIICPLSKIFQLLLLWRKLEYPEISTDLSQVTDKTISHNVLSSAPRHEWGSNSQLKDVTFNAQVSQSGWSDVTSLSGNRQRLHR